MRCNEVITLSRHEAEFLLHVLDLPDEIAGTLERVRAEGLPLTDDVADDLRDLCGERLQAHGFGDDYEPTEEGLRLEKLIDSLFVG